MKHHYANLWRNRVHETRLAIMSERGAATMSCKRYHQACMCDECVKVRTWVLSLDPSHLSSEVNKRAQLELLKNLGAP